MATVTQAPHFSDSGASPPRNFPPVASREVPPRRRQRVPRVSSRYLRHVSYTVVRENEPANRDRVDSPELAAQVARRAIPDDGREHFVALFLDSQNRLTGTHLVSTGSLSASIVHPRELFGPAIREGAAHVVLAHVHPSGDPSPSKEDVALTRQLVEGGRILGIRVHDHVIIGAGSEAWLSFSQRGLL
jgi:DNA repair protein RadC